MSLSKGQWADFFRINSTLVRYSVNCKEVFRSQNVKECRSVSDMVIDFNIHK